ncbi:MAG: LamG-like jellyroll fold domain-containing protein, partial [Verrucomicrobiota bacterium]
LLNVEGQITASHTLPFPNTGGWTSWATQDHSLHFTPGIHTIRLTAMGNAGPNLDRLEVTSMDRINKSSPLPETSSMQSIDDQWHMLALSLNEQTASLYLDGIILSKSPFSKFSMPSGKIVLNKAAAKAQYYLDELRIYERALSSEEINHLYRQGKFIDEG